MHTQHVLGYRLIGWVVGWGLTALSAQKRPVPEAIGLKASMQAIDNIKWVNHVNTLGHQQFFE